MKLTARALVSEGCVRSCWPKRTTKTADHDHVERRARLVRHAHDVADGDELAAVPVIDRRVERGDVDSERHQQHDHRQPGVQPEIPRTLHGPSLT
jgi:hypothetical protein